MSAFACPKVEVPLEAFTLSKRCLDDTFKNKINLSVGAYRTEKDEPWVLPVVRKVEQKIAADETLNKEYLPILGLEKFSTAATKLLLGNDSEAIHENRAFGIQTLSGTGALHVAARFLAKHLQNEVFYVSVPTYENHNLIFASAGFKEAKTYRYWDRENRNFDVEGMLEDLRGAPERSAIVLHACAHNPTGCDPTREQWKRIADVMEERNLFPVLDCAYQGFASGNFDDDAWSVRYFVSRGFEFFACQSFAKNFGLYKGAPIEVFALNRAYVADSFKNKVNLGVGAYRTEKGEPWVFPVVRQVEKALAADETLNKEYLPVLGLEKFSAAATKLLLGSDSPAILENRAFGVQALSGTGSLRVAAEFLARQLHYKVFYVSEPTWGTHNFVFKNAGFGEGKTYRYWHEGMRGLDIEGMLEDLRHASENAVVILHGCAHNPTGSDPTHEEWQRIADVVQERKLFPILDCAYQGFASGDLDKDAWSVRYFASRGFEFLCCQSFAKNFGLYNERIGNLTCVVNNPEVISNVKSQLTVTIRGMYSTPPSHGARIVAYVLAHPHLVDEWKDCVKKMALRIIDMRKRLREELEILGTPGTWKHITDQIGMYSYTGLNEQQSLHMVHHHHIYMMRSGRISMCGLNASNVGYVAKAIHETVTNLPAQKL